MAARFARLPARQSRSDAAGRRFDAGSATCHVEATYLAWIDARGLGVDNPLRFFEDAGVGLYDGALFGSPGFLRLNFAARRGLLEQALQRMRAAVRGKSQNAACRQRAFVHGWKSKSEIRDDVSLNFSAGRMEVDGVLGRGHAGNERW